MHAENTLYLGSTILQSHAFPYNNCRLFNKKLELVAKDHADEQLEEICSPQKFETKVRSYPIATNIFVIVKN